jgi:hypothetical protein
MPSRGDLRSAYGARLATAQLLRPALRTGCADIPRPPTGEEDQMTEGGEPAGGRTRLKCVTEQ